MQMVAKFEMLSDIDIDLQMVDNFWDVVWLLMCCSRGTVSYIPCSHIFRGILVLALSSVSSGCVCGWVCVCELGHIWLAFDLGEALRCMPKMWTVGLQLIVTCPWLCGGAYCWEASSQFSAAAFRGEGREVSFLFPTDSSIIGPFGGWQSIFDSPRVPKSGLPRDYY